MKTALMETTTLANGLTKPGAPAQLIMMHTRTAKAGKTENKKMEQAKRNTLSFIEKSKIATFLDNDEVLEKRADQTCWYRGKYDARVVADIMAKMLGKTVTEHNIAGVRREAYGNLVSIASPKALTVRDQLQNLSVIVEQLQDRITQLEQRLTDVGG